MKTAELVKTCQECGLDSNQAEELERLNEEIDAHFASFYAPILERIGQTERALKGGRRDD
jgi:hypothetical protein